MVVPSFVWPAVGPLLAILASAAMMLIDAGPETSIGGSLKLLRLGSALSLLLSPSRRRVARRFLENKLYAKNNLPLLAEQGPEAFHMAIQGCCNSRPGRRPVQLQKPSGAAGSGKHRRR